MCLAVPGRLVEITGGEGFERFGVLDFDGVRQQVCLAYLPDAQVGDYLLAHVGFAISRVDAAAAEQIHADLRMEESP